MSSFPFLVWVRMTFACIIPVMFLSEFELAPNIVITSLFYLNIAIAWESLGNSHIFSYFTSFLTLTVTTYLVAIQKRLTLRSRDTCKKLLKLYSRPVGLLFASLLVAQIPHVLQYDSMSCDMHGHQKYSRQQNCLDVWEFWIVH